MELIWKKIWDPNAWLLLHYQKNIYIKLNIHLFVRCRGLDTKILVYFLLESTFPTGVSKCYTRCTIWKTIWGPYQKKIYILIEYPFIFQVSWVRYRDTSLLSVGKFVYISDRRFKVLHEVNSSDWFLVIKSVTYNDQGIYECQVNSDPYRTFKFHLSVVGEYFSILPIVFFNNSFNLCNFPYKKLQNAIFDLKIWQI